MTIRVEQVKPLKCWFLTKHGELTMKPEDLIVTKVWRLPSRMYTLNKIQPTTSKKNTMAIQPKYPKTDPKPTKCQQNQHRATRAQILHVHADGLGYSITCDGFTGLGPAGGTTRFLSQESRISSLVTLQQENHGKPSSNSL